MFEIGDLVIIDNIITDDKCEVVWVGKNLVRVSINGHEVNISKKRITKNDMSRT